MSIGYKHQELCFTLGSRAYLPIERSQQRNILNIFSNGPRSTNSLSLTLIIFCLLLLIPFPAQELKLIPFLVFISLLLYVYAVLSLSHWIWSPGPWLRFLPNTTTVPWSAQKYRCDVSSYHCPTCHTPPGTPGFQIWALLVHPAAAQNLARVHISRCTCSTCMYKSPD